MKSVSDNLFAIRFCIKPKVEEQATGCHLYWVWNDIELPVRDAVLYPVQDQIWRQVWDVLN